MYTEWSLKIPRRVLAISSEMNSVAIFGKNNNNTERKGMEGERGEKPQNMTRADKGAIWLLASEEASISRIGRIGRMGHTIGKTWKQQ
jgi:hypothetical protein